MQTLILSLEDTRSLVQHVGLDVLMDEMIARLTIALETFDPEKTPVRSRDGFHYRKPELGLMEWMPHINPTRVTIKIVGYHPSNPRMRGLPTILSTISSYDTASGHLMAIVDGTYLTALRTGAVSGIASQLLANPDSRTLGLIGCGAQAVTQLHAVSRVFDLDRVLIYDVDSLVSHTFGKRVACLNLQNLPIQVVPRDELTAASDILCTATSVGTGEGPVFEDRALKPWLHINAAGSDFEGKVELPLSLVKRSLVCPDVLDQAIREGECQQLKPAEIGPVLYELAQQKARYRSARQQQTVFDSTGWALEDEVAMEMFLDYASDMGLGTSITIESASADPKNPYHFLAATPATADRPRLVS